MKCILAVQFHPEKLVQQGKDQWLALFEYYISLCREKKTLTSVSAYFRN